MSDLKALWQALSRGDTEAVHRILTSERRHWGHVEEVALDLEYLARHVAEFATEGNPGPMFAAQTIRVYAADLRNIAKEAGHGSDAEAA